MIPRIIDAFTRRLGAPKNWDPERYGPCDCLHIQDVQDAPDPSLNRMVSAWEPTPEELFAMIHGAPLYLSIVGTEHPPVALYVGTSPPATAET